MALLTTWTAPVEIGATDPFGATVFNEQVLQNLLYLSDRPISQYLSDGDASWNSSSTVPIQIDSGIMRQELETITGNVEVSCNLNYLNDNDTQYVYFNVEIDDDYLIGDIPSGTKVINLYEQRVTVNSEISSINLTTKILGLTAGVHSFNPMIWVNGGTFTWHGAKLNEFTVREI